MRIISDFRDYYDSAAGHGSDPDLVYRRKTRQLYRQDDQRLKPYETGQLDWAVATDLVWRPTRYSRGLCYIGFCGRVYPLVIAQVPGQHPADLQCVFCYTPDELLEARKQDKRPAKQRFEPDWMKDQELQALKDGPIEDRQVFEQHNSPIFLAVAPAYSWSGKHCRAEQLYLPVSLDIRLQPLEFMRVHDPYTAFQELSMFLSGVLGWPGNAMVEIPEEYRIAAHGYDRHSFRKTGPTGRKARKKRRKA